MIGFASAELEQGKQANDTAGLTPNCKQGPRIWLCQSVGAAAPPGGRELREANDRGGYQVNMSAQILLAQFSAYTPSSSLGAVLTPPDVATVLKVFSAATYSCTLAT